MLVCGVDVARGGDDKTVAAVRNDYTLYPLYVWEQADTMVTSGRINRLHFVLKFDQIIVDVNGIGAGVFDRLREQGLPVVAFHPSMRDDDWRDSSGELRFVNLRAYAWWTFREKLDPRLGFNIRLPEDDMLIEELISPHYKETSKGWIQIEDKDAIKKRLGRSPDRADAVTMCFYEGSAGIYEDSYQVYSESQIDVIAEVIQREERVRVRRERELAIPMDLRVEQQLWAGANDRQRRQEDEYGIW